MIKAPLKIFFLLAWGCLWFIPVWLAKTANKKEWRDWGMRTCSRGLLYIAGIRLHVTGQLSDIRPLLVVSNHLTYFDIPMLSSQAPLRFTPKSEIANWPLIGAVCDITDSIYVDRRPEKVKDMRQSIRDALAKGEVVSLFPESTTGNGIYLLPFKSGFFSLAEENIEGKELTVQPVAFTYTHIRRLPIDSTQWPAIAWYGDMNLMQHLCSFLNLGPLDAEVAFLPPVTLKQFADRKQLAAYCHRQITEHIESIKAKSVTSARSR
jgi:lyso-ornithine lipid O-acyltransferase